MTHFIEHLPAWSKRTEVRLGAFGVSAVGSVYVGFIGLSVESAEWVVKRGGYFLMLISAALFVQALVRLRSMELYSEALSTAQRWIAILVGLLLTVMAVSAEPYQSKVLNDEFVLQSTAFNMHHYRDVATMVRGYEIGGIFASLDNYLDKRPYFYPFLVSLAHDFTGYRPLNAFLVNSGLMAVTLWLAFMFGRILHGFSGGMLALLLLGSLPLLAQNATGSGMELTNVVMILIAMLLGAVYLSKPDDWRLAAFLLSIVLLAQSRYESALYVASAAAIILIAWLRLRRASLPWVAAAVPWLLLPVALQNKVLSHSPVLWELADRATSRFDVAYLPSNFRGAIDFLFNRSAHHANSLALSVLGAAALVWALIMAVLYVCRGRRPVPAGYIALICFGSVILANTLLIFCYYWSRFNDPIAARFSLPLHLLMAFLAVGFVAYLGRWRRVTPLAIGFIGVFAVASAASKMSYHFYSHLGVAEVEWQRRYLEAQPLGKRLIVTNQSTIPWLLYKTPSILVGRARLVADRLHHQLHEPTFDDILVMQTLRPSTPDGDHQIVPEDMLPAFFRLEPMAEKRFGTRISRISKLIAVDLPSDWIPAPGTAKKSVGE